MKEFQLPEMYNEEEEEEVKCKNECIITWKVYDQCRQQDCLTPAIIGPARYAGFTGCTLGGVVQTNEAPIEPPIDASGVTIVPNSLNVSNVIIVSKTENAFKPGYYDIDLKVVVNYSLRFFRADGTIINLICSGGSITSDVPAESIFNKKVTLFGSIGSDVTVASDFFPVPGPIQRAPFVFVEAKAVPLEAKLRYVTPIPISCPPSSTCPPVPNAVDVTLGLFIIVKLFRTVQLLVESKGFCRPEPCPTISPDACEFFSNLDFPFNVFNPPQKEDFCSCDE